jgi:AbrB family looped-hinge helix DNA binding protein
MNHEMITEISKGYQVTIPAEIRKALGLGIGSPLEISRKRGKIVIEPIESDMEKMFEIAKTIKPRKQMSVSEMESLNEKIFSGK